MNATAKVLDRLAGVKPTGPGRWIARCPIGDILAAPGLTLADLFERPLGQQFQPSHSTIPARDVLAAVSHEIDAVVLLLDEIIDGRGVTQVAWERLALAAARLGAARDQVNPARAAAREAATLKLASYTTMPDTVT